MTSLPWSEFRDEFIALYDAPMRARNTQRDMRYALALLENLGVATTADVTTSLIGRLVASRPAGESPRTIVGILGRLRAATRYAETCGYLSVCPFRARGVRQWVRLGPPIVKNHHSREEIRRVLDLMKMDVDGKEGWAQWRARRLYALTSLVAMCALRRNEALYAHVADVDFLQRVFWVRPHGDNRGKTAGSEAPVPMPEALVPILECWLEHRLDRPPDFVMPAEVPWLFPTVGRAGQVAPWTSGETGRKPIHRLQAVAARAGVAGMTWQSLRRSWATHAEFHGLGPAMIQRVLRHTTPRTAELWYRTSDLPNLKQAVKGITF